VRDVVRHRKRCWVCQATVSWSIGRVAYFSYSRGFWMRFPLCRACIGFMYAAARERRAEAK
jgi:hypothetical protein